MTPYQRGGRDALLAVAVELETNLDRCSAEAKKWRGFGDRASHNATSYYRSAEGWEWQVSAFRSAIHLCRRRAGALPDDPEDEP